MSFRFITIPESQGTTDIPRDSRTPTGLKLIRLDEAAILPASRQSAVLGIGGPPNSGKSTLAASLGVELNSIISSLESRGGQWANDLLGYRAEVVTLDLGTPVADSVLRNQGADKQALENKKRPWSDELVEEALKSVRDKTKGERTLVIADLPGKIDAYTDKLARVIDIGCVMTRDWSTISEWGEFFASHRIPVAGEFFSTNATSMVTYYVQDQRPVRGRIHHPDRVVIPWDATIQTFANLLLFEILQTLHFG